jgi:hypothetical protein
MLRRIGIGLVGVVAALVVVSLGARSCDGPLGPIPGGALRSGEEAAVPGDWSFASELREIELQLESPPRSRIVWLMVHEGELYVPCGFLAVPGLKQWPYQVEADDRVVVRAQGKRYAGRLARVRDPELYAALGRAGAEKYGFGSGEPDPEGTWYFRFLGR